MISRSFREKSEQMRGLKCNLKKTLTFKGQAMETSLLELPISI